jgi:hypothetical protein
VILISTGFAGNTLSESGFARLKDLQDGQHAWIKS